MTDKAKRMFTWALQNINDCSFFGRSQILTEAPIKVYIRALAREILPGRTVNLPCHCTRFTALDVSTYLTTQLVLAYWAVSLSGPAWLPYKQDLSQ